MVGVAGKFAGCETCRSRRVKCGNERPICKKCVKTDRHCQGYERPRTFIVGTQEKRGRVSIHDKRDLGGAKANTPKSPPNNKQPNNMMSLSSPLNRIPDASLNEIQILALRANILTLEPVFGSRNGSSTFPLLHCLPDLTKSSPALEYALRALCLIHIGVTKKDYRLIKESAHINLQAMAKVRKATFSSVTSTRIETLAASICLYLYEQAACTAEKGYAWRILFQGSSFLVRQRGPASYKTSPDHHFFVRLFRNNACFDALSRSVSTFLAEPEWLTVPWETITKSDMDCLFDIQFHLPAIFERENQIKKHPPSAARELEAKKLLDRCMNVVKMFDDWYEDLHARSKEPLFWSIPRQTHKERPVEKLGFDMCSLFPNYLQFVDLNTAFLHLYYWAALSLFYRKIQYIHRLLIGGISEQPMNSTESSTEKQASISPPPSYPSRFNQYKSELLMSPTEKICLSDQCNSFQATSSKPLKTTFFANPAFETPTPNHAPPLNPKFSEDSILDLARLICKSLPYALNRTFHCLGPDHSAWPVWCALQVFRRQGCTGELAWCTKMLEMWVREGWKFGFQMERGEWR